MDTVDWLLSRCLSPTKQSAMLHFVTGNLDMSDRKSRRSSSSRTFASHQLTRPPHGRRSTSRHSTRTAPTLAMPRTPAPTRLNLREAREQVELGIPKAKAARELGVSRTTPCRELSGENIYKEWRDSKSPTSSSSIQPHINVSLVGDKIHGKKPRAAKCPLEMTI